MERAANLAAGVLGVERCRPLQHHVLGGDRYDGSEGEALSVVPSIWASEALTRSTLVSWPMVWRSWIWVPVGESVVVVQHAGDVDDGTHAGHLEPTRMGEEGHASAKKEMRRRVVLGIILGNMKQ